MWNKYAVGRVFLRLKTNLAFLILITKSSFLHSEMHVVYHFFNGLHKLLRRLGCMSNDTFQKIITLSIKVWFEYILQPLENL